MRLTGFAKTCQVCPLYTDVDEAGRPLGIEILFVKRHLAPEDLTSVTFNLLGAAQPATPVVREE